jgi:hypothetical protein
LSSHKLTSVRRSNAWKERQGKKYCRSRAGGEDISAEQFVMPTARTWSKPPFREEDGPYHQDGINLQLHRIFLQSGMASDVEVEDYFLRKLRETAINPVLFVPLLSRSLKGYVPYGHQTCITNGKYPTGIDQLTEVKVIHSGTVQYGMPDVRDDPQESAAIYKFQGKVKATYIAKL